MLDSLRFVQGAVAKKDFVPALTHFQIKNKFILGFNGMLGLRSPIALDLDVNPRAVQLIKAIQTCKDTIQLNLTSTKRLSVKSGKFKALIDCIEGDYPEIVPEGTEIPMNGDLLAGLKRLAPFIAEDASRPWARGILLRGQSGYATNNIIIVEYWLGYDFPVELNIPRAAVMELLRIGEEPTTLQVAEDSVTFHFPGDRWLRTQTYTTEWPAVHSILDRPSEPIAIPEGMWEAIEDLLPFVDEQGRLYFSDGAITTGHGEWAGAEVAIPDIKADGCFNATQIQLLRGVAETLDLTGYPGPCAFFGDRLRGAIVGIRK